ncbi:hypothetical protein Gotur_032015, partial [Gossypium turneri]
GGVNYASNREKCCSPRLVFENLESKRGQFKGRMYLQSSRAFDFECSSESSGYFKESGSVCLGHLRADRLSKGSRVH